MSGQARQPDTHTAGVIPVRPDGRILLLLRDDRPGLGAANQWSTLGGHLEPGETPAAAAWREVEEETGLRPTALYSLGVVDGPSLSRPWLVTRQHLYAARVTWDLDEIVVAEGQGVDWFTAEEALRLKIAGPVRPAVERLLSSALYRALADGQWHTPAADAPPLREEDARTLGIRPGALVVVHGAPAGFLRRLWDVLDGARVTASPAPEERADVIMWWPRGTCPWEVLPELAARLRNGGLLWLMRAPSGVQAVGALAAEELARLAGDLGLIQHAAVTVAGGHQGIGHRRLPPRP